MADDADAARTRSQQLHLYAAWGIGGAAVLATGVLAHRRVVGAEALLRSAHSAAVKRAAKRPTRTNESVEAAARRAREAEKRDFPDASTG